MLLGLVGLGATLGMAGAKADDPPGDAWSSLAIDTAKGRFVFRVEMARTDAERAHGLQGRRLLAEDAGMLFDFRRVGMVYMWMKDTDIPLDMLFITANGRVASLTEGTEPLSLRSISSKRPVLAVLEVNAGTVARLGIRPGDRVEHPLFAPAKAPTPK